MMHHVSGRHKGPGMPSRFLFLGGRLGLRGLGGLGGLKGGQARLTRLSFWASTVESRHWTKDLAISRLAQ